MKYNCAKRNFVSVISDPSQTILYADYNIFFRYSRSMSKANPQLFHVQGQPFSQGKLCFVFKNLQNTVPRNSVCVYAYLNDFTFLAVQLHYSTLLSRGISYEFLIHRNRNPMEFILHTNKFLKIMPKILH